MYPVNAVAVARGTAARRSIDPHTRACIDALAAQEAITPYPYYSKVRIAASRSPAAPAAGSYTVARGTKVRAFSYGIGKSMASAGWANGEIATIADTNIANPFETNSGESVLIHGIAIQPLMACGHLDAASAVGTTPRTRLCDAHLLAALTEAMSITLAYNVGKNQYPLGTLTMIPGAGGLEGAAPATVGQVALAGEPRHVSFATNGMASRTNFWRVPEGIWWNKKGEADSDLSLDFELERAVQIFTGGDADNNEADTTASNAVGVVATGTEGYTYPSEINVAFMVFLIGTVVGPRGRTS